MKSHFPPPTDFVGPLTSPDYWRAALPARSDSVRPRLLYKPYFDRFLPRNNSWTVLEIGACPGGNLAALSLSHGYRPVGLDFIPELDDLPERFQRWGVEGLETIRADFFSWETDRRFNVVMSLGFIEHFKNAKECIRRHWSLVANDGYMVVGLPIFGPMQLGLRKLILTKEKLAEVLSTHNIDIMDVSLLARFADACPGACKLFAGYVGEMGTWFRIRDPYVRRVRGHALWLWRLIAVLPRLLHYSCRLFSPYALLFYRKSLEGHLPGS